MFYPKCTHCGGKTRPSTAEQQWDMKMGVGQHMQRNFIGRHPAIHAGLIALKVGREVYKRVPGWGQKVCVDCNRPC